MELQQALERLARAPVILVATDYDGTISPIVDDPALAVPHREALVALRMLGTLPQTHVALISGRALRDLASLTGGPEGVHLVGSHGSEFDLDFASSLSREQAALRSEVESELRRLAPSGDGFYVETKPASVALHYRNVEPRRASEVLGLVESGIATHDDVAVKRGKMVLELSVVKTDKGRALDVMRQRLGASAVIFFGDDITDEDAFRTLAGPDVGVKVGGGETAAPFRVAGPRDVAQQLAKLAELRAAWLEGASAVPLTELSFLSDQRTAALVAPGARVVWFCVPRLDSPALFAELLGGPTAGYFSIRPTDGASEGTTRYLGDSLVLETQFDGIKVTDLLDGSDDRPRQRPGRTDLIRIIEGTGRVTIEFAPRLDFGRTPTYIEVKDEGLSVAHALDPIVLRAPGVTWTLSEEGGHQTARAEVELTGRPLCLELRYGTGSLRKSSTDVLERASITERLWADWAMGLELPSVERSMVKRSAVILKGLCYGPRGGIAAAATTSLPESMGGIRNWDYRYCWLRDAAMTAAVFVKLGSNGEAMQFLDWVLNVVDDCDSPEQLQPLYTLKGGELGTEAEISELAGYRGSRPVRVGNLAARQVQLDVFGPIVELVALLAERDAPLSSEHFRLVEQMVRAVERRWQQPDHGIWEIRAPHRHHVHSKVMCWVTVDRAARLARRFQDQDNGAWVELAKSIQEDVLARGFHEGRQAFTTAYGFEDLDAAALYVGLSGMVPATDPRFHKTLEAVEKELKDGPVVYRYRCEDGLPGREGAFLICASWLVESYLLVGRRDDAWRLFSELKKLAGKTGVFTEMYDPQHAVALGNLPQAYSHLGLIENAISLAKEPG